MEQKRLAATSEDLQRVVSLAQAAWGTLQEALLLAGCALAKSPGFALQGKKVAPTTLLLKRPQELWLFDACEAMAQC
jgi:hypothetical protein